MPPGLSTLLAERYERRSVMVTSNLVFSPWDRNVRAPSRLSPVRYVTVWSSRGVDERGAAGALPGAAEGRRVPDPVRRPADRRSRPQQWNDAVQTLLALQDQYREWRDALPESLAGFATADSHPLKNGAFHGALPQAARASPAADARRTGERRTRRDSRNTRRPSGTGDARGRVEAHCCGGCGATTIRWAAGHRWPRRDGAR